MLIEEDAIAKMYNKTTDHICPLCGQLVELEDALFKNAVFVCTKRYSSFWYHHLCVRTQYDYLLDENK